VGSVHGRVGSAHQPVRGNEVSTAHPTLASIAAVRGTEPARLSKLVRGELDWIVMKALEKDRSRRYETASALASDLQHYLNDEPVVACPPSAWYRLRKVAWRHRRALALAAAAGVMLVVTLAAVGGSIGWSLRDAAARQAAVQRQVQQAINDIQSAFAVGNLPSAMAELKRAEGLIQENRVPPPQQSAVQRWRSDLDLAVRLDEIRLERSTPVGDYYDWGLGDAEYQRALRDYGIDLEHPPDAAARCIRDSALCSRLIESLDDWANAKFSGGLGGLTPLVAVACLADDDPFRIEVREAVRDGKTEVLVRLAADERAALQPAATVSLLGNALRRRGRGEEAATVLHKAQVGRPDDFWLNVEMAATLARVPASAEQAVGYYRAALMARPQHAGLHSDLGAALIGAGRPELAEDVLRHGLEIDANHYRLRNNLAVALARLKRHDEAEVEYRRLLAGPRDYAATGHAGLGGLALDRGNLAEAERQSRAALRLQPEHRMARANLTAILRRQNRTDELVAFLAAPLRDAKLDAERNSLLANTLAQSGRWQSAADAYQKALAQQPDDDWSWYCYAVLLAWLGDNQRYAQACQEMLTRFEGNPEPQVRQRVAKGALLLPDSSAAVQRRSAIIAEAMRGQESHRAYWHFMFSRALAEYRGENSSEARIWAQRVRPRQTVTPLDGAAFALIALCEHQAGDPQSARDALGKARATVQTHLPDFEQQPAAEWERWLVCLVLLREADQLLPAAAQAAINEEARPM
jgi:tetratricopeptide (TPR) repeat protein